jgi:hypothetical protein
MKSIEEEIVNEFYKRLDKDKIKINWNKNTIKMSLFLSFLTVSYERSHSHLGDTTGWTKLLNEHLKLEICGGLVDGVEYLDSLQYGNKLSNQYNNYVNPFFLFNILNKEGQLFFIDYYKDEMDAVLQKYNDDVNYLKSKLSDAKRIFSNVKSEVIKLRNI